MHENVKVQDVRELVEWYFPDPTTRKRCLEIFATTILKAHDANPRSWAVTLNPGNDYAIRLTVGMIYVCNLYSGGITFTVFGPRQDVDPLRPFLSAENIQQLEHLRSGDPRSIPNAPRFPSLPEAVWCWFKADDINLVWPLVQHAYNVTIALAEQQSVNPKAKNSHAPIVLEYIRSDLGIALPDPDHTPAQKTKRKSKPIRTINDPRLAAILNEIERRDHDLYESGK
jgi:hypothetical protein